MQQLLSQIEEIEKLPEDEWQPGWAELVAQKAALEEKLSQGQAALAELENQLAACQEAVSYTHLDVYKRQDGSKIE